MKKRKVFLGGTVVGTNPSYGWRGKFIPKLNDNVEYFNPVVKRWDNDSRKEENRQKKVCDYNLFVITPDIHGYFSIFEATDLSNKRPNKVIFCVIDETFENDNKFNRAQSRSLNLIGKQIEYNGGKFFTNLDDVANYLNSECDGEEKPYLLETVRRTFVNKKYNPNYGDNRKCKCGHSYYRHFDSWADMRNVGCKYCGCDEFVEQKEQKEDD